MRAPTSIVSTAALFLTLASVSACDGPAMALQAPVDSSAPQAITHKGKIATYGSWTSERTKGGAIRTITVKAGPWAGEVKQMDFEYKTSGGPASWTGSCSFDASGQHVSFSKFGENSAFACTLNDGSGEWTLFLARNGSGRQATLDGKLEGPGGSFDVTMTRTTVDGKTPLSPLGYHFAKDGAPVAAVQVASPKQLWMAEGLDQTGQDSVAAAVGALLFVHPAVQQTFTSL